MTAAESHARLAALVANDAAEVHVLLAARSEDDSGFNHQKVDMGAQVASHFLRAARHAAANRDATLDPVQFQPGDYPSIRNLVYLAPHEVPGVDATVAAMEPLQNQANYGGDPDFQRRLAYYVIRVSHGPRTAYFFHRASKKLELVQKGLLVRLHDHRFNQVHDRLFLFDDKVDFIVFEGYVFLNTFDAFMKLFANDIKTAFAKQAEPVFAELRETVDMENFDEFEAACRDDARLSAALIRIQQRGGLNGLTTDWIAEKNALLTQHQLTIVQKANGIKSILYEPLPTKRFILMKILEEKVNRGERSGITWIAGSHIRG